MIRKNRFRKVKEFAYAPPGVPKKDASGRGVRANAGRGGHIPLPIGKGRILPRFASMEEKREGRLRASESGSRPYTFDDFCADLGAGFMDFKQNLESGVEKARINIRRMFGI